MLTIASEVDGVVTTLEHGQDDLEGGGSGRALRCLGWLDRRCGGSIFGFWGMRMALLSTSMSTASAYISNYLPSLSVSQGATLEESAIMLTVLGSVDLVGRTSIGLFADIHLLRPSTILAISLAILGVICHCLRFFNTFSSLVAMSAMLGLFIGHKTALNPALAIELVGVELVPQALSCNTLVSMLAASAMNPIFGAFAEATGNFINVLHIIGIFFMVAALGHAVMPLMTRIDVRQGKLKRKL